MMIMVQQQVEVKIHKISVRTVSSLRETFSSLFNAYSKASPTSFALHDFLVGYTLEDNVSDENGKEGGEG